MTEDGEDPVRERLEGLIRDLTDQEQASRAATRTVQLDQTSVGRVSRVDALQAQAMAQETERRRQVALARAHRALEKLREGEYGHCEACDEPIAPERLRFDPAATLCIRCAEKAG